MGLLSAENTSSTIRKWFCLLCMMVLSKSDVPLSPSSPISPLDYGLTLFQKTTLNLSLNISLQDMRSEHADFFPAPKPLPHVQIPRTMLSHAATMLHLACPPKPTKTKRRTKGLWFLQPGHVSSFLWPLAESTK